MTIVHLPTLPTGKEFEEYISGCLQLGGYYIERNIVERDVEEVLELDIILTSYSTLAPEITLVEVKSGDWGFSDLFKVRGWMDYLNIQKGIFVTNTPRGHLDLLSEKAHALDITLLVIPNLSNSKEVLARVLPDLGDGTVNESDIGIWRFSYWVERNLIQRLVHKRKSHLEKKCYKSLMAYYYETNSGIFSLRTS